MKRIKLLTLLLLLTFMTGCLDTEVAIKINRDKSYEIESTIKISKAFLESMAEMGGENSTPGIFDEKEISAKEKEGYTVKVSEDEENKIIKMKKKLDSIDTITSKERKEINLAQSTEEMEESDGTIEGKNIFNSIDNKTYKSNIVYNYPAEEGADMFMDSIKNTFKLELPVKPTSHNATETQNDGKTLIWKVAYGKEQKIDFEFTLDESVIGGVNSLFSSNSITKIIKFGSIIFGIAVITTLIIVLTKKKTHPVGQYNNSPLPQTMQNDQLPKQDLVMKSDPLPMANEQVQPTVQYVVQEQPNMSNNMQEQPTVQNVVTEQPAMANVVQEQAIPEVVADNQLNPNETIFEQTSPTNTNTQVENPAPVEPDVFPENK